MTNAIFDFEILPTHYTLYHNDRSFCGGGVLIAINDSLPSSLISSPSHIEAIAVRINFIHPLILCSVYVPPNSGASYFDLLLLYLSELLSSGFPCIIVGDFNLPNICWSTVSGNSTVSASFCDFIFDWNLTQHVLNPTHIAKR